MTERSERAIELARRYLQSNLGRRVPLAELAEAVGVSRYHLNRVFRQEVGQTPHQYHLTIRLEAAKAKLGAGETLKEIAAELGFTDASHLSRHFKKHFGRTPGSLSD